jgi:hypothetical protein
MSQGNSLNSYLTQIKMSCFFLSFFLPKIEDRKVKQVLSGGWHQWEGEDIRKGCRRVNMVEYYVLRYKNGKMRPVESLPGMGGRG